MTTGEEKQPLSGASADRFSNCPTPERMRYLNHLNNAPDKGSKEWIAELKVLRTEHLLAFHKFVAFNFLNLRFEIGEEKGYWLYDEDKGVYEEVAASTIKEKILCLLIKDDMGTLASDKNAKEALVKFRTMFPERGSKYDDFDADDGWFHAKNGWLNVISKVFVKHTPKRLSRRVSNVAYNVEAECPIYDKFLDKDIQIKADEVRAIDQFSGLLLTKDMSKQKMLVIIGKPGSGKSTLLNVWMNVHGECAMQRQLTELSSESARFSGNEYVGRGLCWFDEVDVKRSQMSNNLGNLITGATINVERKGVTGIVAAKNTVRCVLTANNLPQSAEQGIYRRIILIPFDRSFYDEGTHIEDLSILLEEESSGILNRMLRGLDDLRKMGGFTLVEGHEERIEDYKASSDTIAEFLNTYFVPDRSKDGESYPTKMLFLAYRDFVGDRASSSLTPARFGRLLSSQTLNKYKHITTDRTNTERLWKGLKLHDDYDIVDDKIVSRHGLHF